MAEEYEDISAAIRRPLRRPTPKPGEDPKAFGDRLGAWERRLAIEEVGTPTSGGVGDGSTVL